MDENFDATAETTDSDDFNYGEEIAKGFLVGAAATIGAFGGFLVIGLTISKLQEYKARRDAKKNAQTETTDEN